VRAWKEEPRRPRDAVETREPEATGVPAAGGRGEGQRPRIGFVGAGRVGLALGVAFHRAGWPVTAVFSRDRERRERFARLVPDSIAAGTPQELLDSADLVMLTVPDDAVAEIAGSLRLYSGQSIVHTNGLLGSEVLWPALAAGAAAGSFHPLVAFADPEAAVEALRGATVAVEGDPRLTPFLEDLARSVGATPILLDASHKAAYHAAAVLAAGGFVALLDTIVELGATFGLGEAAALDLYRPLLQRGLQNAGAIGVAGALTGPAVRGDAGTIAAHLEALHRDAPNAVGVYQALLRRQIAIARARGDLSVERAAALLALLEGE